MKYKTKFGQVGLSCNKEVLIDEMNDDTFPNLRCRDNFESISIHSAMHIDILLFEVGSIVHDVSVLPISITCNTFVRTMINTQQHMTIICSTFIVSLDHTIIHISESSDFFFRNKRSLTLSKQIWIFYYFVRIHKYLQSTQENQQEGNTFLTINPFVLQ